MSPNLSFPGAWRLRRNVPLAVRGGGGARRIVGKPRVPARARAFATEIL